MPPGLKRNQELLGRLDGRQMATDVLQECWERQREHVGWAGVELGVYISACVC